MKFKIMLIIRRRLNVVSKYRPICLNTVSTLTSLLGISPNTVRRMFPNVMTTYVLCLSMKPERKVDDSCEKNMSQDVLTF